MQEILFCEFSVSYLILDHKAYLYVWLLRLVIKEVSVMLFEQQNKAN